MLPTKRTFNSSHEDVLVSSVQFSQSVSRSFANGSKLPRAPVPANLKVWQR